MRFAYAFLWAFIVYSMIAHYCEVKLWLGFPTIYCSGSK